MDRSLQKILEFFGQPGSFSFASPLAGKRNLILCKSSFMDCSTRNWPAEGSNSSDEIFVLLVAVNQRADIWKPAFQPVFNFKNDFTQWVKFRLQFKPRQIQMVSHFSTCRKMIQTFPAKTGDSNALLIAQPKAWMIDCSHQKIGIRSCPIHFFEVRFAILRDFMELRAQLVLQECKHGGRVSPFEPSPAWSKVLELKKVNMALVTKATKTTCGISKKTDDNAMPCYAQEPCGEVAGLCKTQECAGQPRHVQLQWISRAKCFHVSEHLLAKAIESRWFIHHLKVAEGYLSQCEQQAYEVKQFRTSLLV